MRKFKVFYHDNSGPKCEEFEGDKIFFNDGWLTVTAPNFHADESEVPCSLERLVIAIPTDCVYSVEEITE